MKKIISKIFLILLFLSSKSFALIEVDITRGNLNPLPVAVSPLYADEDFKEKISKDLNDLEII